MAQSKKEKKELIRSAAIAVISSEGFHPATTDKIAVKAKVAVGTIYNYFQSKEDILTGIFDAENEKKNNFYAILLQMEIDPLEKLRSVMEMHFTGAVNNPDLAKIILNEKNEYLRINKGNNEKEDGLFNFVTEVIQNGIAAGKLKECNPRLTATFITGAMEAVIKNYLAQNIPDIGNAKDDIISILGNGLLVK